MLLLIFSKILVMKIQLSALKQSNLSNPNKYFTDSFLTSAVFPLTFMKSQVCQVGNKSSFCDKLTSLNQI